MMARKPKIHTDVRCPFVGSMDADIYVVGEAPGKDEVRKPHEAEPFIGWSGKKMTSYFNRHGVKREDVRLANLCKYRPHKNKFEYLLESPQLEIGLRELAEDIEKVDPNIIIAFGAYPMYYLTGNCGKKGPGTGIGNWRGSVVPCTMVDGYKVYCSYHPAYLSRSWKSHPIFYGDIGRAIEQSEFKDIRYPMYESIIDPPDDRLWSLAEEMAEAEWLSIDIETFGPGDMSCFGVTDCEDRALCITFQCPGGWQAARYICESQAKKLFQYGAYDINWLRWFLGWEVNNYAFDTYIAAAQVTPEHPRGLDFLTSIYTWFPFYKEERKEWKKSGTFDTLWEYNLKDVVATYQIAMKQMDILRDKFGVDEPWKIVELPEAA